MPGPGDWTLWKEDAFGGNLATIHGRTLPTGPGAADWECPDLTREVGTTATAGQIAGETSDSNTNHWAILTAAPDDDQVAGFETMPADRCGVAVRCTAGGAYVLIRGLGTNVWQVYRTSSLGNVNGSTLIGEYASTGGGEGFIEAIGSAIRVYEDGTEELNISDATHASGVPGLVTRSTQVKTVTAFRVNSLDGGGGGPAPTGEAPAGGFHRREAA